ncbi:hypothetical protein BACCAP_04860 [Pseudoflavonifractor capillosus ATCC 29799]|uniref:Uncharacterized protein n=1 Tax=Pseudoflavonifractor capillosus ATCC 29799 TaxID=411467 RepID=A6P2X5_9FIRM|nr:hypothetical protein BACCAP_04860 [Pseudoflavonifractor capillosus ATCC 29799]
MVFPPSVLPPLCHNPREIGSQICANRTKCTIMPVLFNGLSSFFCYIFNIILNIRLCSFSIDITE